MVYGGTRQNQIEYGYPGGAPTRGARSRRPAPPGRPAHDLVHGAKDSNDIAPVANRSNDDDVVRQAIDELHALGLKVMLKPHVDVRGRHLARPDRAREPRALVRELRRASWTTTWRSRSRRRSRCSASAPSSRRCRARGTPRSGRACIARIRARYPGLLTYAANGVDAGGRVHERVVLARSST